jgi:signal transduction histidine kinase
MTKRLEKLASATTAIRDGDYAARVVVQGVDEVAQLQTNFNAMAGVLETAIAETAEERDKIAHLLDQRRELVASVSHELRTPLTIIRGYLDSTLGQNAGLTPELQRDLSIMHGEALRLQRLIDDLFALSRAEVGSLTLHPRECDVAAMLRRCAEATSPAAWRTHRVEILVESDGPLPRITVDPDRLEQVIFNLINNAVRHSPPGGLERLSAERSGDFIQIAIADTGEGIAPDELNSIWDRFYRGRNAKDVRGSGIGLAIVRELTEAMDGEATVASTIGEGTTFTLRFPIDHELQTLVDGPGEARAIPQTTSRQSTADAQA